MGGAEGAEGEEGGAGGGKGALRVAAEKATAAKDGAGVAVINDGFNEVEEEGLNLMGAGVARNIHIQVEEGRRGRRRAQAAALAAAGRRRVGKGQHS